MHSKMNFKNLIFANTSPYTRCFGSKQNCAVNDPSDNLRWQKNTNIPKQTRGIFWRDTSEESAWLLVAKNFLGFLCAHQNDTL